MRVEPDDGESVVPRREPADRADVRAAAASEHERTLSEVRARSRRSARRASRGRRRAPRDTPARSVPPPPSAPHRRPTRAGRGRARPRRPRRSCDIRRRRRRPRRSASGSAGNVREARSQHPLPRVRAARRAHADAFVERDRSRGVLAVDPESGSLTPDRAEQRRSSRAGARARGRDAATDGGPRERRPIRVSGRRPATGRSCRAQRSRGRPGRAATGTCPGSARGSRCTSPRSSPGRSPSDPRTPPRTRRRRPVPRPARTAAT